VVSESFKGKSLLARHRMVNDLLRAEFAEGVHALAIEAKAPED
jgi:BolA protein